MLNLDKSKVTGYLTNCLIYGGVKAELKVNENKAVFSRILNEETGKQWLDVLNGLGVHLKQEAHPFDAIESYIQLMDEIKFTPKDSFIIWRDGLQMHLTVTQCPYSMACQALIDEGIDQFNCVYSGPLIVAGKIPGYNLNVQAYPKPGKCKITFEI